MHWALERYVTAPSIACCRAPFLHWRACRPMQRPTAALSPDHSHGTPTRGSAPAGRAGAPPARLDHWHGEL